jgi:O-Antigen ligase
VGARVLGRLESGRYFLIVAIVLLSALGAFGGASRADELQQVFVRCAAIAAIVACLWPLRFAPLRDAPAPIAWLAIAYLLLIAQLVPLPASLWSGMPGHELYARVASEAGSVGWRPWTLSPDRTLNAIGGLLPATAMGLLALFLDFRGRVRLAECTILVACGSAVLGLIQLASGGESFHLFRISSTDSSVGLFANRNHQAVLMAGSIPIVSALAAIRMREEQTAGHALTAAGSIVMLLLLALAATGSRMGLLLGAIGLGCGLLIYLATAPRERRTLRPRALLLALAAALAAIIPVSILIARSGAVQRLATSQPVDETRVAALGPMLEAARAFFPFGSGFGTFDPVFRQFEPFSLLSTIYLNQAHNEPMQLVIEGGIAALLLLAAFILWWVVAAVRSIRPRESSARRALGMAGVAVTLIILLSSLVDYPLRTPLLSSIFAIACVELIRSKRRVAPSASRGAATAA